MNRFGRRLAGAVALAVIAGMNLQSLPASAGDPVAGDGEVIVRYTPGTTPDERVDARQQAEVEFADNLLLPRTQVVSPESGHSVPAAIASLESDPNVRYAEPNYVERLDVAPPNDGHFGLLWGLNNTAQNVNGTLGTDGADMDALAGWNIGRTSSHTVTAVIDSGIALDHPDLAGQLWTNPGEVAGNGIDDDVNGFVDDVHGWDFVHGDNEPWDGDDHGTHTAGTIGAAGDNGIGIAGVSWDARLMPLQVCPSVGGCPVSSQINAIGYAAAMGARVANISIGGTSFSQARRDAIAAAPDILFSVSAGNDATGVPGSGNNETVNKFPCQDDQRPGNPPLGNIICVAASDQNDAKAAFSNYGSTSVDLAAPGVNVLSTYPSFQFRFNDSFDTVSTPWDYAAMDTGALATAGGWERNLAIGHTNRGITDSFGANYLPASNATVTMTGSGVDLSGRKACRAEYYFRSDTEAGAGTLPTSDWFYVEAAHGAGGPWATIDAWSGNYSAGWNYSSDGASTADLGSFEGDPSVFFRMRLQADADTTVGSGAIVDDFKVRCADSPGPNGLYAFKDGTSMAAPQVAGVASIVRELNPGLSPAGVKEKILGGADPVAAFATGGPTPTVTGGRANLMGTLSSLDLTPPAPPGLQSPANGAHVWGDAAFSWSPGDPSVEYGLVLDHVATAFSGPGLSSARPPLTAGRHDWSVTATDGAGNVSGSGTFTFTYTKKPPVSILSLRPRRGSIGGAVLRVKLPGAGTVKVQAKARFGSGGRIRNRVIATGSAQAPEAGTAVVVVAPHRKGRRLLRGRRLVNATFRAVFRGRGDPGHPGAASRRGRFAAPTH